MSSRASRNKTKVHFASCLDLASDWKLERFSFSLQAEEFLAAAKANDQYRIGDLILHGADLNAVDDVSLQQPTIMFYSNTNMFIDRLATRRCWWQ